MQLIFVNDQQIEKVISSITECPSLKYIILMEEHPKETKESYQIKINEIASSLKLRKIDFQFFNEIQAPKEKWTPIHKKKKEDISTLIYTSGSTGTPKGKE